MNSLHVRLSIFVLGIVMVVFATTSCGPTQEEIMAREKARIEAEAIERAAAEERRRAEEERLERIRATEKAGDEAARLGQFEKALEYYQKVLKNVQRYSEQDQRVRQAVIKVVRAMPTPPPLPESVMRSMVRGEVKLKMGGSESVKAATEEMEQAVFAAPWVADAYFNLGIVQEKAEMFDRAIQNLKLYLFASPQSPNANAVQVKIYGLEVLQEEQKKTQSLAGNWRSSGGNTYKVTIDGKKIRIEGSYKNEVEGTDGSHVTQEIWYVHDLDKKGSAIEGFVTISHGGIHGCSYPNETVPESGFIREDGNYLKVEWKQTIYKVRWQGNACLGVSSLGKRDGTLELVQRTGN